MGLFKSVRQLKKQADEINQNYDPGARAADTQARMKAATESMASQTAAANLASAGKPGSATITAVRQGQTMVNFQPLVEIDLTVTSEGQMPYPATVSQIVPQTMQARVQPGATVKVMIDPEDPASLWIDWASPAP